MTAFEETLCESVTKTLIRARARVRARAPARAHVSASVCDSMNVLVMCQHGAVRPKQDKRGFS